MDQEEETQQEVTAFLLHSQMFLKPRAFMQNYVVCMWEGKKQLFWHVSVSFSLL